MANASACHSTRHDGCGGRWVSEVDDEQRVFTSADVAALADAVALVAADIVDENGLVELARPLGNLMSRLAAAQTTFISEVLGARIALGHNVDDPELADELAAQALATTQELLPILERTTLYTWRRHLAAEVERALFPDGSAVETWWRVGRRWSVSST